MEQENNASGHIAEVLDNYLNALKGLGFEGEVDSSYSTKLVHSTDNSIYQQYPQAVIFAKSNDDIQKALALSERAEFSELSFGPRGGGTGTNGQSLTGGIVLDLSRHMREIIEVNTQEKWVRVQGGVIKDQLNDYLRPLGFFFAPDLSTSNRATIGGMINTDASGQGSLVYGKTSDHLISLKCFLPDGYELDTSKMSTLAAKEIAAKQSRLGQIFRDVINSCEQNRTKILEIFPKLNRFLTGYDLKNVFSDDMKTFDLTRIIAGSEGTLGVVAEAKLNILPIEPFKALVNINYDNFESALRHSPFLVSARSTSVETVDSKVLNLAREDMIWRSVAKFLDTPAGVTSDGLNMVEFNGQNEQDINTKVDALTAQLEALIASNQSGVVSYSITTDKADIIKVYAMRKKAVGLLGNTKGGQKPIAFVEDTAVPPEHLADFIIEFRALLDSYNLAYGMFGHVDAGVLHVRPALDLCDTNQQAMLKPISDKVAKLTKKYGGLFWGEHGKGFRSEYGPEFFGPELFLELRKVKTAFDKKNKLNPRKICTPLTSKAVLAGVNGPMRARYDQLVPINIKTTFQDTLNCNGNGLCFNYNEHTQMCPSYKVTKDRRDSPKGRAMLFKEWTRLQVEQGVNLPLQQSAYFNGSESSVEISDVGELAQLNHEVKRAMDTCLACKACSTACPVKVDIPNSRAYFLHFYHQKYGRTLKDHMVGNIERLLPVMSRGAAVLNTLIGSKLANYLSKWVLGYQDLPLLSKRQPKGMEYDYEVLSKFSQSQRDKLVLVVLDPFTWFYEAELIAAVIKLADKLGKQAVLLPYHENGKTKHIKGFLPEFKSTAITTSAFLQKAASLNIPMIGLDSAMVFVYDDEYRKVLTSHERGDFQVLTVHEWLKQQNLSDLKLTGSIATLTLLPHCSEETNARASSAAWQQIFKKLGVAIKNPNVGCCGMAGTFGHESKNQVASETLYQASWQQYVKTEEVVATGFSCRSQVKRFEGQKPMHPVEFIAEHLS
ncbi:D-2-hydroxyglutarate dehydrogenase YdiJ [Pseudoalteromonas luteoviolacea]|uniref:D-2-hydroxyglutarate dehydrogenase YdiJ n=1 Tax=Pseudoalteromonas luteoviolacea TaxID=43657 RepID=UPI001B366DDB|nr:FAD-binding and (Fe-S)-binding domain-containing protein [Pseudoalteromonas luteoviolacea]MBQ4835597.1 FAD-binding oxidoreductase [Pseudoalteromonas luteoviolacea]